MQIIRTRAAMREYSQKHAGSIGFVPTMGYLHDGHLSLVKRSKEENAVTVVSIFVNPAQFNNPEDLEKYPVDLERDLALLEKAGVDCVFAPPREEIYPSGLPVLQMRYPSLMAKLCGAHRPGHFEGVLLIVHNLFMWVNPRRAYFGLKDYQQYLLIKKMAHDLEFTLDVIGCPLVRDSDGLALSSRNVRLSPQGRQQALAIPRALEQAEQLWRRGEKIAVIKEMLHSALSDLEVEYAELCDAESLSAIEEDEIPATGGLVAVAVYVEGVRLIDNVLLFPQDTP